MAVPDPKTAPVVQKIFDDILSGLKTQSEIREEINQGGLNLKKSNFSLILRNKFYMGIVNLPPFQNEPARDIPGIHKPLVSEYQFLKVQEILEGRNKKKNMPAYKTRLVELPHRGEVLCQNYGEKLTGSRSKGNGGYYFYYHFNKCEKVRFRADKLDESFLKLLESLEPADEIKELFELMLEK
ncbi:MAG: recombinase family protein [bacterium]